MIRVGFEPTPFRTSALSWRLRPLGHLTFVSVLGPPVRPNASRPVMSFGISLAFSLFERKSFFIGEEQNFILRIAKNKIKFNSQTLTIDLFNQSYKTNCNIELTK